MRKLILMTVLSVFSVLAFAQETPAEVSTAPAAEATPEAPSAAEVAANKLGGWLGRIAQRPVALVSSFTTGVKTGFKNTQTNAATTSATASESKSEVKVATAVEGPASTASAPSRAEVEARGNALRERFAGLIAMAQGRALPIQRQAPAPVEDRSVRTVVTGSSLPASTEAETN